MMTTGQSRYKDRQRILEPPLIGIQDHSGSEEPSSAGDWTLLMKMNVIDSLVYDKNRFTTSLSKQL